MLVNRLYFNYMRWGERLLKDLKKTKWFIFGTYILLVLATLLVGFFISKNNTIVTISAKIKVVKPSLNSAAIDALNIITIGTNPKTINMIDMILIILNEFVGIFFKLISPFYFF